MKKILIFLLAASAVLFTSCDKVDGNSDIPQVAGISLEDLAGFWDSSRHDTDVFFTFNDNKVTVTSGSHKTDFTVSVQETTLTLTPTAAYEQNSDGEWVKLEDEDMATSPIVLNVHLLQNKNVLVLEDVTPYPEEEGIGDLRAAYTKRSIIKEVDMSIILYRHDAAISSSDASLQGVWKNEDMWATHFLSLKDGRFDYISVYKGGIKGPDPTFNADRYFGSYTYKNGYLSTITEGASRSSNFNPITLFGTWKEEKDRYLVSDGEEEEEEEEVYAYQAVVDGKTLYTALDGFTTFTYVASALPEPKSILGEWSIRHSYYSTDQLIIDEESAVVTLGRNQLRLSFTYTQLESSYGEDNTLSLTLQKMEDYQNGEWIVVPEEETPVIKDARYDATLTADGDALVLSMHMYEEYISPEGEEDADMPYLMMFYRKGAKITSEVRTLTGNWTSDMGALPSWKYLNGMQLNITEKDFDFTATNWEMRFSGSYTYEEGYATLHIRHCYIASGMDEETEEILWEEVDPQGESWHGPFGDYDTPLLTYAYPNEFNVLLLEVDGETVCFLDEHSMEMLRSTTPAVPAPPGRHE